MQVWVTSNRLAQSQQNRGENRRRATADHRWITILLLPQPSVVRHGDHHCLRRRSESWLTDTGGDRVCAHTGQTFRLAGSGTESGCGAGNARLRRARIAKQSQRDHKERFDRQRRTVWCAQHRAETQPRRSKVYCHLGLALLFARPPKQKLSNVEDKPNLHRQLQSCLWA